MLNIFLSVAKKRIEGYSLNDQESQIVSDIVLNMLGYEESNYGLDKGILLVGNVGTGKTMIFKIIQQLYLAANKSLFYTSCDEAVQDYDIKGYEALNFVRERKEIVFDDMGAEEAGTHYGKKVEVVSSIIKSRYELYQNTGTKTHFTSNITLPEIEARYGTREIERILHMCHLVSFPTNKNKRKISSGSPLNYARHTNTHENKESSVEAKEIGKNEGLRHRMNWLCLTFKAKQSLGGANFTDQDNAYLYDDLKEIGLMEIEDGEKERLFVFHFKKRIQANDFKIKTRFRKDNEKKFQYSQCKEILASCESSEKVVKTITERALWNNFFVKEALNHLKNEKFNKFIDSVIDMGVDISEVVIPRLEEYLNKNK